MPHQLALYKQTKLILIALNQSSLMNLKHRRAYILETNKEERQTFNIQSELSKRELHSLLRHTVEARYAGCRCRDVKSTLQSSRGSQEVPGRSGSSSLFFKAIFKAKLLKCPYFKIVLKHLLFTFSLIRCVISCPNSSTLLLRFCRHLPATLLRSSVISLLLSFFGSSSILFCRLR